MHERHGLSQKKQTMFDLKKTKLIDFYYKYLSWINKYVLVTLGCFILMCLDSDCNLYKRYKYDERIRSLHKQIKFYQKEIDTSRKKLEELRTDKEGLERFAREEYYMKRANEDVYIIEEN